MKVHIWVYLKLDLLLLQVLLRYASCLLKGFKYYMLSWVVLKNQLIIILLQLPLQRHSLPIPQQFLSQTEEVGLGVQSIETIDHINLRSGSPSTFLNDIKPKMIKSPKCSHNLHDINPWFLLNLTPNQRCQDSLKRRYLKVRNDNITTFLDNTQKSFQSNLPFLCI